VVKGNTLYEYQEQTDQVLAWNTTTWSPKPLELPKERAYDQWWIYPGQEGALALNDLSCTMTVHRLPGFEKTATVPFAGRPSRAAISDALRYLAVAFQGGDIPKVLLWDLAAKSERPVFGDLRGKIVHLSFSPNSQVLMGAAQGGEIGLWSVSKGKALPSPVEDSWNAQEDWPRPPFFGPDSTRLYLNRGREGKGLEAWDWSKGTLLPVYEAGVGRLYAFAISPDESILAAAGSIGTVVLLDTKNFQPIGRLSVSGAPITTLAFSRSGRLLAGGGLDRSSILWDVKTQIELGALGGNEHTVQEIVFAPDEQSVLTRMGNGQIVIWDLRALDGPSNLLWRATNRIEGLTVSSDERVMATKDSSGNIHVWDSASGRHIQSVQTGAPNSTALLFAMSFSPTQPILAWSGCSWFGILDYQTGQSSSFALARQGTYCNPGFSPDGREFAVASSSHIMIFDVATRQLRPFAAIQNTTFGLAFSPSGTLLASGQDGGALSLWERATGRQIAKVHAHTPGVFNVIFSPDGRLIATTGLDTTGKLWDVIPGGLQPRLTLRGLVGRVGLVFSPDGRRVAASSEGDHSFVLWDTDTGLQVGTIYGRRGGFLGFAFARDGNAIYSAAEDGEVRIWPVPPLRKTQGPGSSQPTATP
jgi:WD40 repeat protein